VADYFTIEDYRSKIEDRRHQSSIFNFQSSIVSPARSGGNFVGVGASRACSPSRDPASLGSSRRLLSSVIALWLRQWRFNYGQIMPDGAPLVKLRGLLRYRAFCAIQQQVPKEGIDIPVRLDYNFCVWHGRRPTQHYIASLPALLPHPSQTATLQRMRAAPGSSRTPPRPTLASKPAWQCPL